MDLAIKELEYLKRTPGFAGVESGSNINGIGVGDLRLDPFFEACEALERLIQTNARRFLGL